MAVLTPRAARRAGVLAALILLLTACSPIGADMDRDRREAELVSRPSLEDAVARQDEMLAEIRGRLAAEVGPLTWSVGTAGNRSACGFDYPPDSAGEIAYSPLWGADESIADDRWPQAQQIVGEISARFGFPPLSTLLDRPGDHQVFAYDAQGAYLSFGTRLATSLRADSACHLPRSAPPA